MKKHIVIILWIIAAVILISSIVLGSFGVAFSNIQDFSMGLIFISLIASAILIQTLRNKNKNKYRFWLFYKLAVIIGIYIKTMIDLFKSTFM